MISNILSNITSLSQAASNWLFVRQHHLLCVTLLQHTRQTMKRIKPRAGRCLWPWLVTAAGMTAVLLVTVIIIQETSQRSPTSPKHIKFLAGYPSFCQSVAPIHANKWLLWHHSLTSHLMIADIAHPAAAIYQASQESLATGQRVWGPGGNPAQPSILSASLDVSAILQRAGSYPPAAFKGRGIVIVGGGSRYSPPAFACVTFIRKSGCQLPIEVWAPPKEPVPAGVVQQFLALGALVKNLGDVYHKDMHKSLRRYVSKPAAILASSFKEVLLLDSDNIPLRDPTYLFDQQLYSGSGVLTWPDFWKCEAKPAAWDALGIPTSMRPEGSHESGQLLIDKETNWQALLLALYLNFCGDVFYPMLSNRGQGDKETLPYAWLSLAAAQHQSTMRYGLVPHGVMAVGVWENGQHNGFAMLQRGPEGGALFLHAHMPKVNLEVDSAFTRKWVNLTGIVSVSTIAHSKGVASDYRVLNEIAGYDVELAVHKLRQQLRCDPAWTECCL